MSAVAGITIRTVHPSDLDVFYAHQLDPESLRMVGFVSRERDAFDAHWDKIQKAPQNINRTTVAEGRVAGYVACFPNEGHREVAYWLGREFWGQGIATQALRLLLVLVTERPINARVATHNLASIKVLQKCGFRLIDQGSGSGDGQGPGEHLLRLES